MPSSRRPDSTDTSACPPSCAIVMTLPASRHDRESSTTAMAMSPVRPMTQAGGSGWLPDTRSQSRASTLMVSPSWAREPGDVAGQQGVADEGHRVDQEVRDDHRHDPAPAAEEEAEDQAHDGVAEERAHALVQVVGAADHRAEDDRPGRPHAEPVQPAQQVA